jgi:hypothetical protein
VVDPKVPGFAQRAAFLLNRDGYCVVKDVLDTERLAKIRRGCEIAIREMVGRDPDRSGNRGSHRYSFGGAPAHFGLQDYWAVLKDPTPVTAIMEVRAKRGLRSMLQVQSPPPVSDHLWHQTGTCSFRKRNDVLLGSR